MGLLRFLLAVSVVFSHTSSLFGFSLLHGKVAVQTFYVISGFYMALILNEKYIGKKSYFIFLSNRLLRIFPIYYIVLMCSTIVYYLLYLYKPEISTPITFFIKYFSSMDLKTLILLVFSNVTIFFQDIIMFLGFNPTSSSLYFYNPAQDKIYAYYFMVIPQAWSLSLEIMFYLIAPFIVRKSTKIVGTVMLLSLILRLYLYSKGYTNDTWAYRFFPNELFFFLLGSLVYKVSGQINKIFYSPKWSLILTLLVIFNFSNIYPLYFDISNFGLIEGMDFSFIFTISLLIPSLFKLSTNWKLDNYLGELSYPIYIIHSLVLQIILILNPTINKNLFVLSVILISILFSDALNTFFIKKIDVIRQKRYLTQKNMLII